MEKKYTNMNRIINITAIPKEQEYIGYLWLSNSKVPEVYLEPSDVSYFLKDMNDDKNPFIIEGQLFSEGVNKSYSIKYVDGEHIVVEYDLNSLPEDWVCDEDKTFIPNRINVTKLKFRQYWKPEADEFCEGMEVLQPAAFVFVGFEIELKVKEEK